ncbi:fumarylacetoacetate hydrolase family protein [Flavonifractor sp. AGMB03687]|uniref:2-keto-4-pentenoate hydratase n=1 Tax=Flavonifractor sp. AGMB03687 TaxID=2785133 RepID=UPI001AE06B9D
MNRKEIEAFGLRLAESSRTHQQIDQPSVTYPDITYDEAYAIQDVMVRELVRDGWTISGKKVGLTSNAMRRSANIYEPDYGFIFHQRCYPNGVVLPTSQFLAPRIECELAFLLKDDLEGLEITRNQVIQATEYVVACIEVVDFRIYRDKVQRLVQDSIADNAAFGAYVLGDIPIKPDQVDLPLVPYVFEVNHQQVEVSSGAAVYDDPAHSVAWLAQRFTQLGNPLRKGELILSGSAVSSVPVSAGDYLRCTFGPFGEVSCSFS